MLARSMKPKQVQNAIAQEVATLLAAKVVAEVERERVDARAAKILAEGDFRDDEGNPIKPKTTYLIPEVRWDEYFAAIDAANRAAGYAGEPGTCPALVAEFKETEAEWALIRKLAPLIGLTFDQINSARLEMRQKFLDLAIGLALAKV